MLLWFWNEFPTCRPGKMSLSRAWDESQKLMPSQRGEERLGSLLERHDGVRQEAQIRLGSPARKYEMKSISQSVENSGTRGGLDMLSSLKIV